MSKEELEKEIEDCFVNRQIGKNTYTTDIDPFHLKKVLMALLKEIA